jgi:hypothetical protein
MTTTNLDARYGRTPARRSRTRMLAWGAAVGVAIVLIAWVAWAGLLSPGASLQARDSGFRVLTDHTIEVDWQLTAPVGSEVSCAVKAISEKKAVVGWKVVEVEPSDQAIRNVSAVLRTTEKPDGGLLYRCWLT